MTRFVEGRVAGSPNRDKIFPFFWEDLREGVRKLAGQNTTSWPKFKHKHSRTEMTKIIHPMLTLGVN
jgi:hypothetical protein